VLGRLPGTPPYLYLTERVNDVYTKKWTEEKACGEFCPVNIPGVSLIQRKPVVALSGPPPSCSHSDFLCTCSVLVILSIHPSGTHDSPVEGALGTSKSPLG
jgi:hypothetical protein